MALLSTFIQISPIRIPILYTVHEYSWEILTSPDYSSSLRRSTDHALILDVRRCQTMYDDVSVLWVSSISLALTGTLDTESSAPTPFQNAEIPRFNSHIGVSNIVNPYCKSIEVSHQQIQCRSNAVWQTNCYSCILHCCIFDSSW